MMIDHEVLHAHIARRPFQPFRVILTNGEVVDVVRVAQAVAMKRRLIVGTEACFRQIWLDEIERVESYDAQAA